MRESDAVDARPHSRIAAEPRSRAFFSGRINITPLRIAITPEVRHHPSRIQGTNFKIEKFTRSKIMLLSTQSPKPRIILGCMTFGPDESAGARVTSLDEYNKCLDYLQAQGYNEIDTARIYNNGKQEAFTADAHWKERGLKLATKWYPHESGAHKPAVLREQLDKSLKELKTDCVDIFYLHAADRSVPFGETLGEINELHKEGKFVQFGLSNFTAFEVAEVVITCKDRGWVRPTIYQAMYNAISQFLGT